MNRFYKKIFFIDGVRTPFQLSGTGLKNQNCYDLGKNVLNGLCNRFTFNLKRILQKVGLGSKLGSFAVALALLIKEDKTYAQHKDSIEAAVVTYLKEENLYNMLLNEVREIPEVSSEPYMTCFGIDVYEKDNELVAEDEYAKTL